jgi:hypothetical protein
MRLWSIHPKYLDSRGLVALWREGLLAKAVLEGKTRGYRNHPQLERFRQARNPAAAISTYLSFVLEEALGRGMNFNGSKLDKKPFRGMIPVREGQIEYEFLHLQRKLSARGRKAPRKPARIEANPVFRAVPGSGTESWEKIGRGD